MPRPRIEGMDERIVASFIERGIFANQKEVISMALKALVREQKAKEAALRNEPLFSDDTYGEQLNSQPEQENAAMGHPARKSTAR